MAVSSTLCGLLSEKEPSTRLKPVSSKNTVRIYCGTAILFMSDFALAPLRRETGPPSSSPLSAASVASMPMAKSKGPRSSSDGSAKEVVHVKIDLKCGSSTDFEHVSAPSRSALRSGSVVFRGRRAAPAAAIDINIEYSTDFGGDESPSWDSSGLILKAHFQRAKQIWEALLPGPGDYQFDFQWDNDIDGLGLTTDSQSTPSSRSIPTGTGLPILRRVTVVSSTSRNGQTLYGELSLANRSYFPRDSPRRFGSGVPQDGDRGRDGVEGFMPKTVTIC